MKDVGFVQIKVIKATDLASADLGGNDLATWFMLTHPASAI